jgi:hypothetical protein
MPHQERLGAADSRKIDEETDVTRDAEVAGMCNAVSVDDDEIRARRDVTQRGNDRRRFTKRKKSRDVGKGDRQVGDLGFHGTELGEGVDDDGGSRAPAGQANVNAGHPANVRRVAGLDDQRG